MHYRTWQILNFKNYTDIFIGKNYQQKIQIIRTIIFSKSKKDEKLN